MASPYLGFSADLSKAESDLLSLAGEWGDDMKAAQGLVKTIDARVRDQLAAEYLVRRLRDRVGDRFVSQLPQHIEHKVLQSGASTGERAKALLEAAGATTQEVRAWAVSVGLLPEGQIRGRLKVEIVEAWIIAHTPKDQALPEELEETG